MIKYFKCLGESKNLISLFSEEPHLKATYGALGATLTKHFITIPVNKRLCSQYVVLLLSLYLLLMCYGEVR